ncbi:hypothetical protein ACFQV2_03295 [Actinokineospora soli]|uniref:Uncharacterized protein n=1 Tax=Actinokineospora soli TaxID=1048753 RepID=A0ABW2TGG8_9PSEU
MIAFDRLWGIDPDALPDVLGDLVPPPPRRLSYLTVHDQQFVDRDGLARRVHTRVVVRAEVPGVDRLHITVAAEPTDREFPGSSASSPAGSAGSARTTTPACSTRRSCSAGRCARGDRGRRLHPRHRAHRALDPHRAPLRPQRPELRPAGRLRPGRGPAACAEYRDDEEHALERTRAPHIVCGDVPPGITGIRWSW